MSQQDMESERSDCCINTYYTPSAQWPTWKLQACPLPMTFLLVSLLTAEYDIMVLIGWWHKKNANSLKAFISSHNMKCSRRESIKSIKKDWSWTLTHRTNSILVPIGQCTVTMYYSAMTPVLPQGSEPGKDTTDQCNIIFRRQQLQNRLQFLQEIQKKNNRIEGYLANEEGPTELDRIEEELKLLEQKEKDLIQKKEQCLTTQTTDKGMCLH
ncbi:hypothetical protein cypCar_00008213 [Cyprinus carpio]|nr:hypothetical protein cypCar_00008213 [Cyprinus carpio]